MAEQVEEFGDPQITRPDKVERVFHVGSNNLADVNVLFQNQGTSTPPQLSSSSRRGKKLPKSKNSPRLDQNRTRKTVSSSSSGSLNRSNSSSGLRRLLRSASFSRSKKEALTVPKLVDQAIGYIERNQLEKLDRLFSQHILDVNSVDQDGHTLLDVAILLNHFGAARLLQLYGAHDTEAYRDPVTRSKRLEVLLRAKQINIGNLMTRAKGGDRSAEAELETAREDAERYETLYRKWRTALDQAGPPSGPKSVKLATSSTESVMLAIQPPLFHGNAVVTHYKIEWANKNDFTSANTLFVPAVSDEVQLRDIPQDQPLYIRVSCLNMAGFGPPTRSAPESLAPSSWRQVSDVPCRYRKFEQELNSLSSGMLDAGLASSIPTVKKVKIKIPKSFKKGLYIVVVALEEQIGGPMPNIGLPSILSSNSGVLPSYMVDSEMPQNMGENITWLNQLSRCWHVAKHLVHRIDDESQANNQTLRFQKLVCQAVVALQSAIGQTDLGMLYPELFQDSGNGTSFLVCVTQLVSQATPKSVSSSTSSSTSSPSSSSSVEQSPKLKRSASRSSTKKTLTRTASTTSLSFNAHGSGPSTPSTVASKLEKICEFFQGSGSIPAGLYLAAFMPHNTVSSIKLTVLIERPCTLPCVRIRPAASISKEEWQFLQKPTKSRDAVGVGLLADLMDAAEKLFDFLHLPLHDGLEYRLYTTSLVEATPDVSFIMILPPAAEFLTELSATHKAHYPDMMSLTTSTFESMFWRAFQPQLVQQHAFYSTILSTESLVLGLQARTELNRQKLADLQSQLDERDAMAKRLASAYDDLCFCKTVSLQGRDPAQRAHRTSSKDSDEIHHYLTLKELKTYCRRAPTLPSQRQDPSSQVGRKKQRQISLDLNGEDSIEVLVEDAGQKETYQPHEVKAQFTIDLSHLKSLLVAQLLIEKSDDWHFQLWTADGVKSVQDVCRPIMMKPVWQMQKAKLVFLYSS